MPIHFLPSILHNLFCALNEKLSGSARAPFQDRFFERLELIPHPEQGQDDTSEGHELIPAVSGTGHLDAIGRWTLLAFLVDPGMGVLKQARTQADRTKVLETAILYRRWLEGDYPSDTEWNAVFDDKTNPPEDQWSKPYATACWLGWAGSDSPMAVTAAVDLAASSFHNQRLGYPPDSPLVAPSFLGRLVDHGINWLVKRLGRGPTQDPMANPVHYLWQAAWLLELMNLRWLPTDPQEEMLFHSVLQGNIWQALGDYSLCLRKNKVDLDLIPRMEHNFHLPALSFPA
jgi:hypothetical protein